MATKRRQDYMKQAKTLARKYKEQPLLEKRMRSESLGLVKGLRDRLMKWDEYERTILDKTLTSALASVILGTKNQKSNERMEQAWPSIVGDMLPPLTKFLAETKEYIDSGVLRIGDQTLDFADYDFESALGMEDETESEGTTRKPRGQTWPALANRVINYVATPTYAFFNLGEYMVSRDMGYKEMRRVAKNDKKTCKDCRRYDSQGWAPFGELPMPGKGCQCYANCRCAIEYR